MFINIPYLWHGIFVNPISINILYLRYIRIYNIKFLLFSSFPSSSLHARSLRPDLSGFLAGIMKASLQSSFNPCKSVQSVKIRVLSLQPHLQIKIQIPFRRRYPVRHSISVNTSRCFVKPVEYVIHFQR